MILFGLLVLLCIVSLITPRTINLKRRKSKLPCDKPIVYPNFLTREQCQTIIERAKKEGLRRSNVLDKGNTVSSVRTSEQVFLPKSDPACRPFVEKVAVLTGVDESLFEEVQILRYRPGEKYDAHYDACFKCTGDGGDLLRRQTCLVYLSDTEQGGETEFPNAKESVVPETGKMVRWFNLKGKRILPCSFHKSSPVQKGEKWAATLWIHG